MLEYIEDLSQAIKLIPGDRFILVKQEPHFNLIEPPLPIQTPQKFHNPNLNYLDDKIHSLSQKQLYLPDIPLGLEELSLYQIIANIRKIFQKPSDSQIFDVSEININNFILSTCELCVLSQVLHESNYQNIVKFYLAIYKIRMSLFSPQLQAFEKTKEMTEGLIGYLSEDFQEILGISKNNIAEIAPFCTETYSQNTFSAHKYLTNDRFYCHGFLICKLLEKLKIQNWNYYICQGMSPHEILENHYTLIDERPTEDIFSADSDLLIRSEHFFFVNRLLLEIMDSDAEQKNVNQIDLILPKGTEYIFAKHLRYALRDQLSIKITPKSYYDTKDITPENFYLSFLESCILSFVLNAECDTGKIVSLYLGIYKYRTSLISEESLNYEKDLELYEGTTGYLSENYKENFSQTKEIWDIFPFNGKMLTENYSPRNFLLMDNFYAKGYWIRTLLNKLRIKNWEQLVKQGYTPTKILFFYCNQHLKIADTELFDLGQSLSENFNQCDFYSIVKLAFFNEENTLTDTGTADTQPDS